MPENQGRPPQDSEPAPTQPPGAVLLVDDEATLRGIVARSLKRAGFTVATAGSGEEALARARELGDSLGVVILDMNMPGMSGMETFAELSRLYPRLPVLFVSGMLSEPHPGELADHAGCAGYLHKPFDIPSLIASLHALLSSSAAR